MLIPFVLPFCMTFFYSDLFHFFPPLALLSSLISLITFLSLHFSVSFFVLFSFPFISSALVCPFVSYSCFISAVIYLLTLYSLPNKKKKLKCTLVQALRLCTGRTARRGSRGIALPFHDHGTRGRWWVSVTPRPLFTQGKDKVPIVQKSGWAPEPVWTGAENFASTGIRSPDRPSHSQSLYRLRYPAHKGKSNQLQAWTGPEGSRRLRFPDFMTSGTWRW